MKRTCLLFLIAISSKICSAQEMWGISNSNYSGTIGIFLNPSTIVGAPYLYEYNLLAGDVFAQNSYVYSPSDQKIIIRSLRGEASQTTGVHSVENSNPQSGFIHTTLIGPSYNHNNGEQAWGFHTAYRNEISLLHVPHSLTKTMYEGLKYAPYQKQTFRGSPFSVSFLSWAELGGTYGMVIMNHEENYIKCAATVNFLLGFDAVNLDVRNLDYTIADSSTVIFHSVDATLSHAVNSTGNFSAGSLFAVRGYGASTTFGATYIHHRNRAAYDCNNISDRNKKYQYRIGLSLIDFGYIRFMNESKVTALNTSVDRTWNGIDTTQFGSFNNFDALLSNRINAGTMSTENKSFNMWLPTAVSLQFDYCLTKMLYADATIINRIRFTGNQVARNNQLDLSLRYERKQFEISANFSLFEYREPSAGVALRYLFFVVGTDRAFEWLGTANVNSFDVFFGIKTNLCELPWKKTKHDCPAYKSKGQD